MGWLKTLTMRWRDLATPAKGQGPAPTQAKKLVQSAMARGDSPAGRGFLVFPPPCPTCQGEGQVIESPCGVCFGTGTPEKEGKIAGTKFPLAWKQASSFD